MNQIAEVTADTRPKASPFPVPVGESCQFRVGGFTVEDVLESMRGMKNHNRHHSSAQDAAAWVSALRMPSCPAGSVVVPGVQLLRQCEDAFIGLFGQGTTILTINYNFTKPLFTGQFAWVEVAMVEVRNLKAFYMARFDSVTTLEGTEQRIGVGSGHQILVPRLPLYPD